MADDSRILKINDNICGARGIWLYGLSLLNTWAYIVRSKKNNGLLLIDTCGPGSGTIIRRAVESMGCSMRDITGIALTHWHRDHTGSLAEIVREAGSAAKPVKVFIHRNDLPFLVSGRTRLLKAHPVFKFRMPHAPGRLPEKGMYTLLELDHNSCYNPLEDYGVDFIHTPGHTPGHTSFLHKKSMTLFSGCAISLLGKNTAGIVPVFSDRKTQVESAYKIMDMNFSFLCPAHMNVRTDSIEKGDRVPFTGKLSLTDSVTGALPIFSYPRR